MSITFEHEANILVWTFGKLITIFWEQQYLFVVQCAWWLSAVVGLKPALRIYLDHQWFPSSTRPVSNTTISTNNTGMKLGKPVEIRKDISPVPRNIWRRSCPLQDHLSPKKSNPNDISDPLHCTRKGWVNFETKAQRKKERKQLNKQISNL